MQKIWDNHERNGHKTKFKNLKLWQLLVIIISFKKMKLKVDRNSIFNDRNLKNRFWRYFCTFFRPNNGRNEHGHVVINLKTWQIDRTSEPQTEFNQARSGKSNCHLPQIKKLLFLL